MRGLALVLLCCASLVAGCSWLKRPEPVPPGPGRVEPAVVPEPPPGAPEKEAPALPLDLDLSVPIPELSYDVNRALHRPPNVQGQLAAPIRRQWKYIVIHHSATTAGSEAAFDRGHKENGWKGVGYDFVVGNGNGSGDGLVEVTFRWEQQITGAHAASQGNAYNSEGIGICLVGNLERDYPTAKQMEALVGLVNYLQERCRIPTRNVFGHRHVPGANTACPGRNFPWYEFYALLEH